MKILLDENMPESVRDALIHLGHHADSIASLRLKGLSNGDLYRDVAGSYDLCLTKDRGFADAVRAMDQPGGVKVVRVTIPQAPAPQFTRTFLATFTRTDWSTVPSGSDWPQDR